jgi:hypothetical protein
MFVIKHYELPCIYTVSVLNLNPLAQSATPLTEYAFTYCVIQGVFLIVGLWPQSGRYRTDDLTHSAVLLLAEFRI